ncbi:chemotaxis response regulator protein-glutamate methylesterase [Clostridia bacterium]|nr:chemotaxis response regulator protein-glutamate methylesterase [Clostridia bacterium]
MFGATGVVFMRFIIATKDISFFERVKQAFTPDPLIGMIFCVSALSEIEAKLASDKVNILLFDTDRPIAVTSFQLGEFGKRGNVLVILTAASQASTRPFVSRDVNEFILKPFTIDTSSFVSNIDMKIKLNMSAMLGRAPLGGGINSISGDATAKDKIVAIASSTGGTDALEKVFAHLPSDCPPLLVVQHMPSGFTKLFAERLNNFYPMRIKEAQNGDLVRKGQILIAPADQHMAMCMSGNKLAVRCFVGQKIHAVMPASDVLFESVGPIMKSNVIGVVLTGMGEDGARGLFKMHVLGAKTICQDEATSVVYGMPKAAFNMGAVDFKLPLQEIGKKIMQLARKEM